MGGLFLALVLGALGITLMVGAVTVIMFLIECFHHGSGRRVMHRFEKQTRAEQKAKERVRASLRVVPGAERKED